MSGRRPDLHWRRLPVSKHGPGVSRRHHIIGDVPRSAKRFASWLGLSPNNRIPGGKVLRSKTKASANRAAAALRLALARCIPTTTLWMASCARKNPRGRIQGHRLHAALAPGSFIPCCAKATQMLMLAPHPTNANTYSGRYAAPNAGRPRWTTNWRQCPMTVHRNYPTYQRPRRNSSG